MSSKNIKRISGALIGIIVALVLVFNFASSDYNFQTPPKFRSSNSPKASPKGIKDRHEYFFNMLRNPALNRIPGDVRQKEINLYKSIAAKSLKSGSDDYTWFEAGPNDVGGRTRALGIDIRNSDIVIAGGVSGGIWKSIDKGNSWELKNSPDETFSVTSLCQDPREGHQDVWYYTSGEYSGNSADAEGAFYSGYGVYKSDDNGETWSLIYEGTENDPIYWDDFTDFISKCKVSPYDGDLYMAANSYGIMKLSEEEDGSYTLLDEIGGSNDHVFCDLDIDASGNILVVLSEYGWNETTNNSPGVYYRTYDEINYSQIDATSSSFPSVHERSIIRFAPSNPNYGYVFTNIDGENVAFHKIDISNNLLIDRSGNLPSFNDQTGKLGLQANYNMTLAVKPNNPDFVIIGNTSLFRSSDGFATSVEKFYSWIGGYLNDDSSDDFTNHHPDCHISIFDPNDNNALWSGHDGGLSYVSNITQNTTSETLMPWVDKNNGYNVTQYYAIADINSAKDSRYLGGTQDNGTPFFKFSTTTTSASKDISSGDGGYCYLGNNYAYVSAQNGMIFRVGYNTQGEPLSPYSNGESHDWSIITPSEATGQLFINPFVVDPNNENVMYYPAGEDLWINKTLESIADFQNETMDGWSAPTEMTVSGYTISALAISKSPAHVLYYAAYNESGNPKVYKLENSASESPVLTDISISEASSGSYPTAITINPANAEEIMVIFSNYSVPSIFHSTDGGASYTQVDGNLSYSPTNTTYSVGDVSVRSASILNWEETKSYFISTSIGVYKTSALDGASTQWKTVAPTQLGNIVCNMVKTCDLDGKVAIATHGRGIFVGLPTSSTNIPDNNAVSTDELVVYPNPNNGIFRLKQVDSPSQNSRIEIYNMKGQVVYERSFNSSEEIYATEYNLTHQPAGSYIVKIHLDDQSFTSKVIIK